MKENSRLRKKLARSLIRSFCGAGTCVVQENSFLWSTAFLPSYKTPLAFQKALTSGPLRF